MARLLLVDDDPDQLEIRCLIMRQAGHEVRTVASAPAALGAFDEYGCDVVVMDLRLPRAGDGIQLIRDLRARSASLSILVLSGWPEDLSREPEVKLVDHFLRKPVRSQALLDLINQVA